MDETSTPLVVDLDGTLTQSDLLYETFMSLLRKNLLYILLVPFWVVAGKTRLKDEIAQRVDLDPTTLPYQQPLIDFLRQQKAQGRQLILATASHIKFAQIIADHFGLFDAVLATDINTNLGGTAKRQELIRRYGDKGFDYAGNSMADMKVWPSARAAILVNPERGVEQAARSNFTVSHCFEDATISKRSLIPLLHPQQWLIDLWVLLPMLLAWGALTTESFTPLLATFISFALFSSAIGLLNELTLLPQSRQHSIKKERLFASGAVLIRSGIVLMALLVFIGISIALFIPAESLALLLGYAVIKLLHLFYIRGMFFINLSVAMALIGIRIVAGILAIAATPSLWNLLF